QFDAFVGGEALVTVVAFAPTADGAAVIGQARIEDRRIARLAERTSHGRTSSSFRRCRAAPDGRRASLRDRPGTSCTAPSPLRPRAGWSPRRADSPARRR